MRNLDQLTDEECTKISYILSDGPFYTPDQTREYSTGWCKVLRPDYNSVHPAVIYKFIELYEYLKKIQVDVNTPI